MPAQRMPERSKYHNASIMRISEWKEKIMETIINDDELSKLLWYNTEDALSQDSLTDDQKIELVDPHSEHRRVYPTRYNPSVVMDQQSFIGMAIAGFAPQEIHYKTSNDYVIGYLYFFVLTDVSIMDIDEGQRHDRILARLYDLFQDSRTIGMGTMKIGGLEEAWEQNNKFGGYTMMLRIYDFM